MGVAPPVPELSRSSNDGRPDPDALLERARAEDARARRGKLKIFFGMAPGVGKTFAMLESARARASEGRHIVVGVVETHGRADTAALLDGLEILPRRRIEYRGVVLEELDLDAAIARRPELVLVDELAHANASGSRHKKRWQDVLELLDAGIDIYSTLNVQHLESLNDIVAQVSGVIVRETVPDKVLDEADEVELVDLPPDDLLRRMTEGKVYLPEQAVRAKEKFFRKGNLIALRELALRKTADRVDNQMLGYRRDEGIVSTWPTRERIVVSVGPSPFSARLIRRACRMAEGLRADWIALYVETATSASMSKDDRDRVGRHLRLAENLGGRTAIVSGARVSEEICAFSRSQNATKIVIGKPTHPRWRDLVMGSLVDDVVRGSGDVDVMVITGDHDEAAPPTTRAGPVEPGPAFAALPYVATAAVVATATALSSVMADHFALADLIMVYLLGVIAVAYRFDRGSAYLASLLSVLALDFFFVPPTGTFAVNDVRHLLTFLVMFLVGAVISQLTTRIRAQVEAARLRETRTAALYRLGRDLVSITTTEELGRVAERHVSEGFQGEAAVLVQGEHGKLACVPEDAVFALGDHEIGVAGWVLERGQSAGLGTDTLPGASAMYLPLRTAHGTMGVLGVRPRVATRLDDPAQLHLLESFASQIAVALERSKLAREAATANVRIETEQLRNALLSSVSHDLRTPLATITGSATTLLDTTLSLDLPTRTGLIEAIHDEANRLSAIVRNLLDVTRLEAGSIKVSLEWNSIEELLGGALARVAKHLGHRPVHVKLSENMPLVCVDGLLIEQVLVHLLENVAKYSPALSEVDISATHDGTSLRVEIRDHGPGLSVGDEEHVFEKFYRAMKHGAGGGVGLGLTIARGIVLAHQGQISVRNHPEGGAVFQILLPQRERPPGVDQEDVE